MLTVTFGGVFKYQGHLVIIQLRASVPSGYSGLFASGLPAPFPAPSGESDYIPLLCKCGTNVYSGAIETNGNIYLPDTVAGTTVLLSGIYYT